MAWMDVLTGRKTPAAGTLPQPVDAVRDALLALSRDTAPWSVRPAATDEAADLVAEWRIVDARWHEVFARAALTRTFSIHMRLHRDKCEVRTLDCSRDLEWRAGVPVMTAGWTMTRGPQVSWEFGTGYAFTETAQFGQVCNYRFNGAEMRGPLQQAVLAQGWTWRPAMFNPL